MRTAGTRTGDRKVDTPQLENNRQVHRHRRIHALKNRAGTDQRRISFLTDDIHRIDHRSRTAVVSVKDTNFVVQQILFVYPRLCKSLSRCQISIFALFGKTDTLAAIQYAFQVRFIQ